MADDGKKTVPDIENDEPVRVRTLKAALEAVKTRESERQDVVVEMKEAARARLEMLADDVRPLLDEIDPLDERFDFAVTRGEHPRLWIDMTTFVTMGADAEGAVKSGYRMLKDTRMGRQVLSETASRSRMADTIASYVAERVLERERAIEGDWIAHNPQRYVAEEEAVETEVAETATTEEPPRKLRWLLFLVLGVLVAAGLAMAAFLLGVDGAL
ncbi:MAG: hypothetical protein AAFO70_02445 [Pseudomonadota bacterium]